MKNHFLAALTLLLLFLLPDANAQQVSKWDQVPANIKNRNSFKRLEWFYRPRMNEQDVFPGAFIAKQKADEYAKMLSQTLKTDTLPQWINLGPAGIDFAADGMVPH